MICIPRSHILTKVPNRIVLFLKGKKTIVEFNRFNHYTNNSPEQIKNAYSFEQYYDYYDAIINVMKIKQKEDRITYDWLEKIKQ